MQQFEISIFDKSTLMVQIKFVDFAAAHAKNVSILMQQLIKATQI